MAECMFNTFLFYIWIEFSRDVLFVYAYTFKVLYLFYIALQTLFKLFLLSIITFDHEVLMS